MTETKEWLPHLNNSVPKESFGYSVSMYSVALEGWRRGLSLTFINKDQIKAQTEFILANENRRYRFSGTRSNIISKDTINICANKYETKQLLKEKGIPVLDGELFGANVADEAIVEYADNFGYPIVIKPYNGNSGEGVVVNIQNEEELRNALIYVRKQLKHPIILMERFIPSIDYQLYIVDNKVVASFERVAANIVGDGEQTIEALLKVKNRERKRNPGLSRHMIDKEDIELLHTLETQGYTLESVPENGERVQLKLKTNIIEGGDPVDVTEELPEKIKTMALKAADSIPNLPLCAVEIITNKETNKSYVLEVKTQPSISGHLFPQKGKAQDVAKEIIDFYFPKTKIIAEGKLYYFDFEHVFQLFYANIVQQYTIPKFPRGNLDAKRIDLTGITNRGSFIKWIQPQMVELGLNGYFKYRRNDRLTLVVSGENTSVQSVMDLIADDHPFKKENYAHVEREWDKPIKIGFEVHSLKRRKKTKKALESDENTEKQQTWGKILNPFR